MLMTILCDHYLSCKACCSAKCTFYTRKPPCRKRYSGWPSRCLDCSPMSYFLSGGPAPPPFPSFLSHGGSPTAAIGFKGPLSKWVYSKELPPTVRCKRAASETPPMPATQNTKLTVSFGELISFLSIVAFYSRCPRPFDPV